MLARFLARKLSVLIVVFGPLGACTSEKCLLPEEVYGSTSRQILESEFESYLGTPDELDVTIFTTALNAYLSTAYSFCQTSNEQNKKCVRANLHRVESLLTNSSRQTPRERMEELLLLPSPTSCAQDQAAFPEFTLWKDLSRRKMTSASSSLKQLQSKSGGGYSVLTSSDSATKESDEPLSQARAKYNRGIFQYLLGNHAQAFGLLSRSSTLSSQRITTNYMLGLTALAQQDFDKALTFAQSGRSLFTSDPKYVPPIEIKLALLESAALRGLERFEVADENLGQFIQKSIPRLGPEHPVIAYLYYEQAWMRAHRRGFGQAQKLLRKAIKIFKQHQPEIHPFVLDTSITMAFMQVESGLPDDALDTLKTASKINEQLGRPELPSLEIEFIRAMAYSDLDTFLDRAINIAGKVLYDLRQSKVSAPYLEARIERWLEAI